MAISEPVVTIKCDGCGTEEERVPPVRFADYSGRNWHYSWAALLEDLRGEGWEIDREVDDAGEEYRATCPDCQEEDEEDEEE